MAETATALETFVRAALRTGRNVVWREERDTGGMFPSTVFVIQFPTSGRYVGGAKGGWGALGCRGAETEPEARQHAERFLDRVG